MAWIETILPEKARGRLNELYQQAVGRAGRVFHIVRLMSLRPRQLQASMDLYLSCMHDDAAELSCREREMVATVVSRLNECHY